MPHKDFMALDAIRRPIGVLLIDHNWKSRSEHPRETINSLRDELVPCLERLLEDDRGMCNADPCVLADIEKVINNHSDVYRDARFIVNLVWDPEDRKFHLCFDFGRHRKGQSPEDRPNNPETIDMLFNIGEYEMLFINSVNGKTVFKLLIPTYEFPKPKEE